MRAVLTLLLVSFFTLAFAQSKGDKIYVENDTKNENVKEIITEFKNRLTDWGHWNVVSSKASADYIVKVNAQTSKGVRLTSWGGTSVDGSVELFDKQGKSVWLSDTYKSSPNGTNGFNSKRAVAKKLVNGLKKKYK